MGKRRKAKPKLTPPDPERCQAEMRSFMTLGPGRNRCNNRPTVIATERKPGKDGQSGSMSLCPECQKVFKERMGIGFADFTPIPPQDPGDVVEDEAWDALYSDIHDGG